MSITNGYATLSQVKASLRILDTIDDTLLELAIEAASREIDGHCERVFYSTGVNETRLFVPTSKLFTEMDDLISVTSLTTASDAIVFDTVWASTDYQLEPLNGIAGGIVQPFTRITAVGDYLFPRWNYLLGEATVKIVGTWGWTTIPTAIKQACVLASMRQFKRYDSPLGVAGFGDIGAIRVSRVDPDVEAMLMPFKKVRMA